MRLDRANTILLVIDVQEKLMPVIHEHENVVRNLERLIRGCHILGVPVIVTEQYVKGLGSTVEPIRRALDETGAPRPIEKSCFSAPRCDAFAAQLAALARRQVLVAGVETHVCVYQSVLDLLAAQYSVSLVADAVSSRTARNRDIALHRLGSEGAKLSSTEMVLFELLVESGTDEFRAIARLVR
jgi:nicotinamidase-related amidase